MRHFFLLFLLIPHLSFSQTFVVKRNSCDLKLFPEDKEREKVIFPTLEEFLTKKGYKFSFMEVGSKSLLPGVLYLKIEQEILEDRILYPDCYVKITIREAKSTQYSLATDEIFFEKSTKRQFPRHTFSGNYRCKKAVGDLFIHIPYCKEEIILPKSEESKKN